MKVKGLGGAEYNVHFHHFIYRRQQWTQCLIVNTEEPEKNYGGYANCSPTDNFCRATGRKIALARAIRGLFNREGRKAFWAAYWEERKKVTKKLWAA